MSSARDRNNVLVLAVCQSLFNSGRGVAFLASSLVAANMLGENLAFVTAPVTMMVVGTAAGAVPAAQLMRRIGRKAGFVIGSLIGCGGGGLAIFAMSIEHFVLFNVALFLFGLYSSFAQQYRFAVADAAPDDFMAKAISLVLAAGVVGAFLGPEGARWSREAFGAEFMGSFAVLIGFTLLSGLAVMWIDIPKLTQTEFEDPGRPLTEILTQPTFVVAALAATFGYMTMNILMTSTPIAMQHGANHAFSDTVFVIEWHVVGMFAPGFFTGHLINRFGVIRIISAGAVFLLFAVAVALLGNTVTHFWIALFTLGIGWNFTFTGGTVLLNEVHTPSERAKAQGSFDMIVFTGMAFSSLFSGTLYHFLGWSWVNLAAVPMILIVLLSVFWLAWYRRHITVQETPATVETIADGL